MIKEDSAEFVADYSRQPDEVPELLIIRGLALRVEVVRTYTGEKFPQVAATVGSLNIPPDEIERLTGATD